MEWVRGATVGRGSFATVDLATVTHGDHGGSPAVMAVKSAPLLQAVTLRHERSVLARLGPTCPEIVACYGDDVSAEPDGRHHYNVFLEYVPGGTLADLLWECRRSHLPETALRGYTGSILRGLQHIHRKGYVHCDVKPQNVLVADRRCGAVKIADFGLAKKSSEEGEDHGAAGYSLRGTPLYMSPESVSRNECEAPSDIWSLGCVVVEMATGRPAWKDAGASDAGALLFRIGFGEDLPEIPRELSEQGRDFLTRCLARDPSKRWTAEMLLNHPFVTAVAAGGTDDADMVVEGDVELVLKSPRPSPRSIFEFPPTWVSEESPRPSSSSICSSPDCSASPNCRIQRLSAGRRQNYWDLPSDDDFWVTVREGESPAFDSDRNIDENREGVPAEAAGSGDPLQLVLPPLKHSEGECSSSFACESDRQLSPSPPCSSPPPLDDSSAIDSHGGRILLSLPENSSSQHRNDCFKRFN